MATTLALSILSPSSVVSSPESSFSPAFLPSFLVGVSLAPFVSQWREKCADITALSVCSKEAQIEALKYFESLRDGQIVYRNEKNISSTSKLWREFLISADGDYRLDFFHPSLNNRIKYIKDYIQKHKTL